jgi:hypothetical protein
LHLITIFLDLDANQIVVNQLILAKALSPLFNFRPLKGTAMNLSALVPHIAVGFNQRIKSYQSKALAKLIGFIIQSNKRPI